MPLTRYLVPVALIAAYGLLHASAANAASTERMSVDSSGVEGNGSSTFATMSADGRYVAFSSDASNLVPDDNNGQPDIFVRDRLTGTTERVSVDSVGNEANGYNGSAAMSANGRFVVFRSLASNLVPGVLGGLAKIYIHDRQTGVTEHVSADTGGNTPNGNCDNPSVSGDGRYVAFYSGATDLVDGDTNRVNDVFVRDRMTGTTVRASVDSAGNESDGSSSTIRFSMSPGGRYVVFPSNATNLVENDNNATGDIFVHDLQTGTTERVSVDGSGNEGNGVSEFPSMGADGRFVAFSSNASNLVPDDTNSNYDIFIHDRKTGVTERVSVDSAGMEGNARSGAPQLSIDNRFVSFTSTSSNLVPDDTNGAYDLFVRDRLLGVTERVSVSTAGEQATGGFGFTYNSTINGNGRFVAFQSDTTNLVSDDTNDENDIFLRDRGLVPDGHNDVLVDFGGAGLWRRLNDAAWQKIHNASPQMVTAGDLDGSLKDEAIADFGSAGLWARYGATWVKLHSGSPTRFVAGDFDGNGTDDLVTDFGGAGMWVRKNDSAWTKLHNGTSQDLAVGELNGSGRDELIADFGGAGLWVRTNDATWVKRHNASPEHIATGDLDGDGKDELIADFGGAGLWARYNDATWMKLHNATSQGIVTGDLDGNDQEELIVDFGTLGLWVRHNNATWMKVHNASPVRMLASDLDDSGQADLVVDFGAAGLWVKYNNGAWTKIHNATTQDLAAGGFD